MEELKALKTLSQAAVDHGIEMTSDGLRLSLRLGAQHAIVQRHVIFRNAYEARREVLQPLFKRSITDEDRAALETTEQSASDSHVDFVEACRKWLMEEQ